jgi:sulfur-carrier protein adenylyltransferase/sulfurtransferase
MIPEVSPLDLARELASESPPILIDVREAGEIAICRFPSYVHIPMMEIPARLGEFDKDANLVVACHVGMRSAQATAYMIQLGFTRVRNLAGGIDQWTLDVDPTLTRY